MSDRRPDDDAAAGDEAAPDEAFELMRSNRGAAAGGEPDDGLDPPSARDSDDPAGVEEDLEPKENFEDAVDLLDAGDVAGLSRVVRLNRRTIGVGVMVLAAICGLVLVWAASPAPPKEDAELANGGTAAAPAQGLPPLALSSLPERYEDLPAPPTSPAPIVVPDAPAGEDLGDLPLRSSRFPAPPPNHAAQSTGAGPQLPTSAETAERERLTAMLENLQLREDRQLEARLRANASPILAGNLLSTGGGAVPDAGSTFGPGSGPNGPVGPGGFVDPLPADTRSNLQAEKKAFAAGAGDTTAVLKQRLLSPASPYLLQAGHTVAATLITEINTDLPGRIIAQVTENAFDSVTGEHLLIPQGSRLLGSYDSLISNGQNRALLRWERLILPNGRSLALDGMLGVDATGAAGVKDRVDYHIGRLIGGVLLSTALTYSANAARNDNDGLDGFQSDRNLVADSIAQDSADIGNRIVDRILDIQPTIKIRQGARVRVLVEADLVLEPYRYNP